MSKTLDLNERSPIYTPPSPINTISDTPLQHHIIDINDSDKSTDEPPSCRICLESDPANDLISPCRCRGSTQYVHRQCLDQWRATDAAGQRFKQCDICKFNFIIDELDNDTPEQMRGRLLTYRLYVIRDIILSCIGLVTTVGIFSLMVASVDIDQQHIVQLFPESIQPHIYIIYILCGMLIFLAMLGMVGSCIACSGGRGGNGDLIPPWYCYCTDCSCIEATAAGDGAGLLIGVIILVVFAVVGAVIGVYFSVYAIKQISQKHTAKLWLQQETKRFIVRDLKGVIPPEHTDGDERNNDATEQLIV